jgi:hypothetical protein
MESETIYKKRRHELGHLFITYSVGTLCTELKLYAFDLGIRPLIVLAWSVGTRVPPAALALLAGRVGALFPAGPLGGGLAGRPRAAALGRRPLHRNHRHKALGTHGHPAIYNIYYEHFLVKNENRITLDTL